MSWISFDPQYGLWGLAIYSFLAATLLPGGSEIALFALLKLEPDYWIQAIAVATLGNTLGGMFTWWCGHALPRWRKLEAMPFQQAMQRWGSPLLFFAWLPVIGDALCLAAGWLRLPWVACAVFMGLGKFARYGLVAQSTMLY